MELSTRKKYLLVIMVKGGSDIFKQIKEYVLGENKKFPIVDCDSNTALYKVFGEALLLASIQFAVGSVEMSSKYSIMNFTKDQQTLNNASEALQSYITVAIIWSVGCLLQMYGQFGIKGATCALLTNVLIMVWIIVSYENMFDTCAAKYSLIKPTLFQEYPAVSTSTTTPSSP